MKSILVIMLFAVAACQAQPVQERSPNRIDGILGLPTVEQCQIKMNLYIQGIRAYNLGIPTKNHIQAKQSTPLTPAELQWVLRYMNLGNKKAMRVWGMNNEAITKAWAFKAGAKYNRECLEQANAHAVRI